MVSCIIGHELPKEFDWLGFLRSELVEWNVVSLLVIHMASSQYRLHQSPIPVGFIDILRVEGVQRMKPVCKEPERCTEIGEI
jgi:hypothetical protein